MILFLVGVLVGLAAGVGTCIAVIQNYERVIEDLNRDLTVAGWRAHG